MRTVLAESVLVATAALCLRFADYRTEPDLSIQTVVYLLFGTTAYLVVMGAGEAEA